MCSLRTVTLSDMAIWLKFKIKPLAESFFKSSNESFCFFGGIPLPLLHGWEIRCWYWGESRGEGPTRLNSLLKTWLRVAHGSGMVQLSSPRAQQACTPGKSQAVKTAWLHWGGEKPHLLCPFLSLPLSTLFPQVLRWLHPHALVWNQQIQQGLEKQQETSLK